MSPTLAGGQEGAGVVDAYGRPLRDLRIAITPECNLDCFFCHMEGATESGPMRPGSWSPVLSVEDYDIIGEAASRLGVDSFKLTGGEPLIRGDVEKIVAVLAKYGEVSMTTNGILLPLKASSLRRAGLARVNVSLHSISEEVYEKITRRRAVKLALKGVEAALKAGLRVKVNMVLLRGLNEGEFWRILRLAEDLGFDLQVIEVHPAGRGRRVLSSFRRPIDVVEERLSSMAMAVETGRLHNRRVYRLPSGVRVYLVDPVENPVFCMGCYRVRLTWDGRLLPCIYWKGPYPNVAEALRRGGSRGEKVWRVMKVLLEANALRRPTYLFRLGDGQEPPRIGNRRGLRLALPGRAKAERLAYSSLEAPLIEG
ncbi:GTP 3',8-cyclase MoaA [Aeropyrum camini]|uniref:Probable GTP 3',8-cyclase n=1 Tax=Aeropyrum camini SY1 = JCM 12091 TaxID=1198449 RepID=U3TBP1_9CREN|nr:GTP 3',8-cyclase MoaA [Aeropyrum camini]BAN89841.1 molybdenum cofactor biosynthesis protein MoaA [Aeropyrum camini SY1 = JCM 12091]